MAPPLELLRRAADARLMTALEAGTHNPRLSIDLRSGKIQARRLSESIERLPGFGASATGSPLKTAMRPPVSANVDAPLIGSSPMLERAIGLMHGRHTQEMHDRHVGARAATLGPQRVPAVPSLPSLPPPGTPAHPLPAPTQLLCVPSAGSPPTASTCTTAAPSRFSSAGPRASSVPATWSTSLPYANSSTCWATRCGLPAHQTLGGTRRRWPR